MTAVAGWREIGRMCGMYEPPQRTEVTVNTTGKALTDKLATMSDAELQQFAAEPLVLDVISEVPDDGGKVSEARRLLAKRELARRRLLEFTKITHPRYLPGWVHDDISRRLERFSEQVANGEGPRLMLLVPPRHGKALALSTQIPTPRGMVAYGHLRVGDYVFAPSGDIIEVTAVGQDLPVDMKVTFSNGAEHRERTARVDGERQARGDPKLAERHANARH